MPPPPRLVLSLCVLGLAAAACGSDSSTDAGARADNPPFIVQGEETLDIAFSPPTTAAPVARGGATSDDLATEDPGGADAEDASGGGGAAETGAPEFDVTEDTVPQGDEADADSEFFDAVGSFMSCLGTEGHSFLGIPSQEGDPNAPENDPGYIDALVKCAASSQIVSKMEAAEDTSDLSAEEIEEQNRNFSDFVDCLTGRGWTIPTPTPDENGVLQPAYVELARTWIPPNGQPLLSGDSVQGDDFAECGFDPNDPTGSADG